MTPETVNPTIDPKKQAEGIPIEGVQVKVIKVGTSGTQIYGGYDSEEYLHEAQGRPWADTIDKIARSDDTAIEAYRALILPLLSANWYYEVTEDSEQARQQKALVEQIMFHDLEKSFKQTLNDILTFIKNGYSLLEKTYKPVLGHPELGDYNSIASLGWRSPRTIERWNIKLGKLQSVTQIAFGDLGKTADIPSEFLVHFCPFREGDNFEGLSIFRGMYGCWLRKNHFLRLLAAGIEKWAIPTPTLEIPAGLENDPAVAAAQAVLEAFVSNSANYITYPQGWKLDFLDANFDPEKLTKAIDAESGRMLASILASFLTLGQNGNSGSRALGGTLGDFFGTSVQFYADHVIEVLERGVTRDIINLNFGKDTPILVELHCDGLKELAEETLSNIVQKLVSSGSIKNDRKLEELLRKKFDLGEIDDATREPTPVQTPQFSEPAGENKNDSGGQET